MKASVGSSTHAARVGTGGEPAPRSSPRRSRSGPATVVYVSHDGMMEPLGASQVLPYVRGLAGEGFRMTVVSFEKPADLRRRRARAELEAALGRERIRWIPLPYRSRPPVVATGLDVLRAARRVRTLLSGASGPTLIHARSYVAGAVALRVHRATGVPFLFDMRGFWIDERIESGMLRGSGLLFRGLRALEARLLEEAAGVVLLTRRGRAALPGLTGIEPQSPIRIIPTCVDMDRFRPVRGEAEAREVGERRRSLGVEGAAPLLVYAGSLSTWYMGEATFRLARGFLEAGGGGFLVLTREADLARSLGASTGVPARIHTVPFAEMPDWLRAADAGVCLVRPGPAKAASAPTKIGEYLATGLAVAASGGVGDVDEQLGDCPVAFTLDGSTPEDGGRKLQAATGHPDRIALARAVAESRFSLRQGVAAYAALYRELI